MNAIANTTKERFEEKIMPEPNSGCWLWYSTWNPDGYGMFWHEGRQHGAHRVSYEIYIGSISDKLQIDHLCRTRCCVNPKHLEAVTAKENIRRGRSYNSEKTHCKYGHRYSEENTYIYKNQRYCRACNNNSHKKRR